MKIHDHFEGSANCVECGGFCQLSGEDLETTRFFRFALESILLRTDGWIPTQIKEPLLKLTYERYLAHAIEAAREIKKMMAGRK